MSDVTGRLVTCFSAVFPRLGLEEVPDATTEGVAEWDSLASLTLVAVIEEEFGLTVDDLDLPELGSFSAFDEYVRGQIG
jgi:acyl carrier protein